MLSRPLRKNALSRLVLLSFVSICSFLPHLWNKLWLSVVGTRGEGRALETMMLYSFEESTGGEASINGLSHDEPRSTTIW